MCTMHYVPCGTMLTAATTTKTSLQAVACGSSSSCPELFGDQPGLGKWVGWHGPDRSHLLFVWLQTLFCELVVYEGGRSRRQLAPLDVELLTHLMSSVKDLLAWRRVLQLRSPVCRCHPGLQDTVSLRKDIAWLTNTPLATIVYAKG